MLQWTDTPPYIMVTFNIFQSVWICQQHVMIYQVISLQLLQTEIVKHSNPVRKSTINVAIRQSAISLRKTSPTKSDLQIWTPAAEFIKSHLFFQDPAWLQGPGRRGELAAVLWAVPSSVEGASVSLLWRLTQPPLWSTQDTDLLGMFTKWNTPQPSSGSDETPSSLINNDTFCSQIIFSDPESHFNRFIISSACICSHDVV